MERRIHQGRNVKRFREMLGVKQEALAIELGEDWNQKRVSVLEGKEEVDESTLDRIARFLNVPVEAIKNFDEQTAINFISNTFHDTNGLINYSPNFNINPFDKWLEALEEIKQLHASLIQEKDARIAALERMVNKKY